MVLTPVAEPSIERLRRRVAHELQIGPAPDADAVRAAVARAVRAEGVLLPGERLAALVRELVDTLAGLGPLEALLRAPDVTDVMVNGPAEVWVERDGRLERTGVRFADADSLRQVVQRVIAPLGLRLDRARPFVDARLADGSRLHALLPPLAPDGPLVTIRRFRPAGLSWPELEAHGAVPADAAALLREGVERRRAVVVCGPTGAGKTTLLSLLLGEVGVAERVVVVEEAAELPLACPHVVRLECAPPNVEGAGEVGLRELVRQALRMRPDRIVVGEARGAELVEVLQALVTGHDGCMTTVHARSAEQALVRMEGMALLAGLPLPAVRAQLGAALDLLVVLGREPQGGRRLLEIAEVTAGRRVRALWRR